MLEAAVSDLSKSTAEKVGALKSQMAEFGASLQSRENDLEKKCKEVADSLETRVEDAIKPVTSRVDQRLTDDLLLLKGQMEEQSKDLVASLESRSLDTMEAL